ncbi:MAG: serine hydrolase domain-containing protein [Pirellulaceae bacterium]
MPRQLKQVPPESVGLDSSRLDQISSIVSEGIENGKMPGCVVCIGHQGKVAYLKAFGHRRTQPNPDPMTTDTVFDMASITKPMATATSIMRLVESGKVRLGAKVVDYLPEFSPQGKDAITVHDLLVHQSGLIPDNALKDYEAGPEVAWQRICELDLVAPVGTTFKYSDVNFIVLAEIVHRVSGLNVHEFSQREIFQPLGMRETGYLPNDELKRRAAPTERRNDQWMQGEVHDPRAYALGGIAGHAGLFSTAQDIALYAQALLDDGRATLDDGTIVQVRATHIGHDDSRVPGL